MRGGVVEKNSVSVFVMLAQAFAMISDHDDQCILVAAALFQISDEVGQRRIGIGDLAVVQMIFVSLRIRRRRLVGIVRIVEVNPDEMGARRDAP